MSPLNAAEHNARYQIRNRLKAKFSSPEQMPSPDKEDEWKKLLSPKLFEYWQNNKDQFTPSIMNPYFGEKLREEIDYNKLKEQLKIANDEVERVSEDIAARDIEVEKLKKNLSEAESLIQAKTHRINEHLGTISELQKRPDFKVSMNMAYEDFCSMINKKVEEMVPIAVEEYLKDYIRFECIEKDLKNIFNALRDKRII